MRWSVSSAGMAFLGKLVLLVTICLVASEQSEQDEMVAVPTLDYERIASIVRAPLFRTNPADSASEGVPSYLPVSYDDTPHELSIFNPTAKSLGAPYPSLVLEVPKPGAVDSFSNIRSTPDTVNAYSDPKNVPESTQILQAYHPNPLIGLKPLFVPHNPKPVKLNYPPQQSTPLLNFNPTNPHSKQLDLPLPSPVTTLNYPPVPAADLQTPTLQTYNQQFNADYKPYGTIRTKNLDPVYPVLNKPLFSPKSESIKPALVPTSNYPKKYNPNLHEYKPKKVAKSVEIEDDDDYDDEVTVAPIKKFAKPLKYVAAPTESASRKYPEQGRYQDSERLAKLEKQRLKFDEVQKKLLAKKEQQRLIDATLARAKGDPVASASGFNSYQQDGPRNDGGISGVAHGAAGERTDFQMFGQHGPHSYKFGYDTGDGHNRQFRYEERDNDGYVKGHYGFYDKEGKLQIVNYDAHPHHGFHAEIGKES